MFYDEELYIRS